MLIARSDQEEFTESNGTRISEQKVKLAQWNIGGDISYSFSNFEPFVGATYENDFSLTEVRLASGKQPANDADDVLFRLGLRYFNDSGISANVEWNKRIGREDFDEDIFNFILRAEF